MLFDWKHKLLGGALLAAFILIGVGFNSWLKSHDAQIQAEATVKAQQVAFDKAGQQIKALEEADSARARETATKVQIIHDEAQKQTTPAEIADYLAAKWGLPGQIQAQGDAKDSKPLDASAPLQIAPGDLPTLRDYTAQCETCKIQRDALQKDSESLKAQMIEKGEQLSAVERERDAYRVAAHGTFWGRVKTGLKWTVIGGAIAGGTICMAGHCR